MTEDQRRQDGCVMQEEGGGQKGNDYNGKVMRAIPVHYGLSSDKNTERCKCQGGRWEAGSGRKAWAGNECPCPACHAFWELSMTVSFLHTLSLLRWWSTEPCWARYGKSNNSRYPYWASLRRSVSEKSPEPRGWLVSCVSVIDCFCTLSLQWDGQLRWKQMVIIFCAPSCP